MNFRLTIVLVLLALTSKAQSDQKISFFFPNDLCSSGESPKTINDRYLGIYRACNGCEFFRSAKFNFHDSLVQDDYFGPHKILVTDTFMPLFMVSGIKTLKNQVRIVGTVPRVSKILPDASISYSLGTKKYTITSKGTFVKAPQGKLSAIHNYQVILTLDYGNKKRNKLFIR